MHSLPPLVPAVITGLAYFLTARLGAALEFPTLPVSALWMPNAITLAALLLANRRHWWLYISAAVIAHFAAQASISDLALLRSAIDCGANCAAILIGAFALDPVTPLPRRFDRLRPVLTLTIVAGVIAPLSTSVLVALSFGALDAGGDFALTVLARTLTNCFATLTVVPLLVHFGSGGLSGRWTIRPARAIEASLLFACLMAAATIAVHAAQGGSRYWPLLLFSPLPVLLCMALRFGMPGLCTSAFAIGIFAIWAVTGGTSTLAADIVTQNTLSLAFLMDVTLIPLLFLAASLTERRAVESESAANLSRFRALFNFNVVPTVLWHTDGHIADANSAFVELTGITRNELHKGRLRLTDLISGGARLGAPAWGPSEDELLVRGSERVPVLASGRRFPLNQSEGVAYFFDLSAARIAQYRKRDSDLLHAAVLASLHDQIVVLDRTGLIIAANDSWRGIDEPSVITPMERLQVGDHYLHAYTKESKDSVGAELLEGVRKVLAGLTPRDRIEFSVNSPDGMLWFEISIEPLRRSEGGAVITRTEITERKRAMTQSREQRQQLAHLSRAAVLGELSGAFAHELNQPLTSILGNAEAALQLLTRESANIYEIREIMRDIIKDDVRAAEVIQRLRSMLSRGEISREPVDLNQVVRDMLELARSDLMTRNVSVSTELDAGALVLGDRVQLQQVVLNLVVNACEAMSNVPPGQRRLTISTHLLASQRLFECVVADCGCGVPAKDLERIFQPFVTTKQQGLGLGLAICRSIVEAHGGHLWAENGPEAGALFRFTAKADA